jgi:hypothetical protein
VVTRVEELVAAGRRAAAIDLLVKARKTHPRDARLAYHAGLLFMNRMWWPDGLKNRGDPARPELQDRCSSRPVARSTRGHYD